MCSPIFATECASFAADRRSLSSRRDRSPWRYTTSGVGTALFSVADALYLRPLAVAEPDRLVEVSRGRRAGIGSRCPAAEARELATQAPSLAGETLDPRVLVTSAVGAVLMGLVASVAPALRALRTDPARVLRLQ